MAKVTWCNSCSLDWAEIIETGAQSSIALSPPTLLSRRCGRGEGAVGGEGHLFLARINLHWHAAGLAKWLETTVQIRTRSLTYRLLKQVDLSIVLSEYNRADAEKLFSRKIKIVSNGIPDPCPNFASGLLPRRKARFAARQKLFSDQRLSEAELSAAGGDPQTIKVLYLAHCTREKGLFEAVSGVASVNERLRARESRISFRLAVTGTFVTE